MKQQNKFARRCVIVYFTTFKLIIVVFAFRHNWSRILHTVEKKNELVKTSGIKHDETQDDDDDDSDDDDDGLDWRAKRVFKK